MQKEKLLGVRQKIASAMALLNAEDRIGTVSISELCRIAGVSRANLYSHHQDLIAQFPPKAKTERSSGTAPAREPLLNEVAKLNAKVQALRCICVELSLELRDERAKIESLERELKKRAR